MKRGIAVALALVIAVMGVWAAQPGSPPRLFVGDAKRAKCFRPGDGIVAFGDSITAGHHGYGFHGRDSWFSYVACERGGVNEGVPSQTSAEVARRVYRVGEAVVFAGTNDVVSGVPVEVTVGNVSRAAARAGGRVWLATIPPCACGDVRPLNRRIRQLADREGYGLLDFYGVVVTRWPALTIDGVHPNEQGAELMGHYALRQLDT